VTMRQEQEVGSPGNK